MVVLLIVVFSAGWVVTSDSAKAMAHEISANAVVDRLAPISVAQFMQDPNREERCFFSGYGPYFIKSLKTTKENLFWHRL